MIKVAEIKNGNGGISSVSIDDDNYIVVDGDTLSYKANTFDEAVDNIYSLWGNPVWELQVYDDVIYKK